MKKILSAIIIAVVAASLGAIAWYRSAVDSAAAPAGTAAKLFVVEKGQGAKAVARRLEQEGLISSPAAFGLYLDRSGQAGKIQAGEYELSPAQTIRQIADSLAAGRVKNQEITIKLIEGQTTADFARQLAADGVSPDFAAYADRPLRDLMAEGLAVPDFLAQQIPASAALEGYLHPDTYRVFAGASNADIAGRMLANFDRKLTADMRSDMASKGLSLPELVTMASLVEKEARIDASGQSGNREARLVSGIFWKRIGAGQRLESCATLAYILGVDKKQYSLEDTQADSPYNTYRQAGLPPGPIGNPGLEAIRAALYPESSDYLFFLNGHDGKTYFAKTYQEHLVNKDKYLR